MGERRRYSAEMEACLTETDRWFFTNENEIVLTMNEFRKRWWKGLTQCSQYRSSADVLDDSLRALSEMPICFSMGYVVRDFPLPGFEFILPKDGWIKVGRKMMGGVFPWATFHGYLFNENLGLVACLTFAQFVLPFEALLKGERINYVADLAPELVTRGGNGLAVLHGTVGEIHKKTGLKYT